MTQPTPPSVDHLETASAFLAASGLKLQEVSGTRVTGWIDLTSDHHQPFGLVHGGVYCSVIEACEDISDVKRAHEWTAALNDWCERQGGIVTYTGQCLVHRATILHIRGQWTEALEEAVKEAQWEFGTRLTVCCRREP